MEKTNIANDRVEILNRLIQDWINRFEEEPKVAFSFDANEEGMLVLKGTSKGDLVLPCRAEDVQPETLFQDVELMVFCDNRNFQYTVLIEWEFTGDPYIKDVTVTPPSQSLM